MPHGTEIVTVARKNEANYRVAAGHMRYCAGSGVKFLICGPAAEDHGCPVQDFQNFIGVAPNAVAELAHQQ